MVCPTCRTEYHGLTYCTRDARRLVPPEDMLGGALRAINSRSTGAGLVCMACRRAYEPGLRSCPHDGNELVPFPVYNATRPRRARTSEPAGVIARICPVCNAKYDLNARFCGHDAGEPRRHQLIGNRAERFAAGTSWRSCHACRCSWRRAP